MNYLLLADQTVSQRPALEQAAAHTATNPLLAGFLEQAAAALQDELARAATSTLARADRDRIPHFQTIPDLVRLYHDGTLTKDPHDHDYADATDSQVCLPRDPAVESALVTVAQLAHYIGYATNCPPPKTARIIPLCSGAFAAVAIGCARSLSELIPIGIHMVRLSFRTGLHVGRAGARIEPPHPSQKRAQPCAGQMPESARSWSRIVVGASDRVVADTLATLNDTLALSPLSQLYVSAVSPGAVTVSGPPAALAHLDKSACPLSANAKHVISVYGPYHAPHIHSENDIDHILGADSAPVLGQFQISEAGTDIVSAATGKPFSSSSALDLTKAVLEDILLHKVRWDHITDAVCAAPAPAQLFSFGCNNTGNSITAALKAAGGALPAKPAVDLSSWKVTPPSTRSPMQHDKIAIVGVAGRFPDAASVDALWALLEAGLDVHREIPPDRFDAAAHCDPSGKGKNKSHTPYGCFIEQPGLFDPRFFNMSPREAAQTDPMGRLALTTAYEALEMSGFVPNRTPSSRLDRVGTFYGQTSDDWREINAAEQVDTYFITGGVRAFAPGRINYFFKFSGPSYSIDTACSSSLAAIQLACTALWAGDCDTACTGGLNVLTNPDIFSGLSKGQFLSKTGGCKTFDNSADGYCRADSCASIILKRYEDAVADNDTVLGTILAAGTNHSAEAISITHPHAGAQAELYKAVLGRAGLDPHDVSYVEMHGTGTQAGDGIEIESVTSVFAPRHRPRPATRPLFIGAIKANVGHAEAASGVNSVVKVVKMFEKNAIPANVGVKTVLNAAFPAELPARGVRIPLEMTPFPPSSDGTLRTVFLNNFSAAGGNTALLLQEAPARPKPEQDPRPVHLVTVAAKSMAALRNNIRNLTSWMQANPTMPLSSIAYTTTARRIQHGYRVAIVGSDAATVAASLNAQIKDAYTPAPPSPPVAFSFTGQGSHYVGLAKELYMIEPTFKAELDALERTASQLGFPTFVPMVTGDEAGFGKMTPVAVQLGISCVQVALGKLWRRWGVQPAVVIGHSLGEYAALNAAGVISDADMIALVGTRARFLVERCTEGSHGMVAVRAPLAELRSALSTLGPVEVACVNGPNEAVLSGPISDVSAAAETLSTAGFKTTLLRVPFAFHSDQVSPIMEPFVKAVRGVTFRPPTVPVLSPLLAEVVPAGRPDAFSAAYLARHAREAVDYDGAVAAGLAANVISEKTVWLEIGPHAVTANMVRGSVQTRSKPGTTVTAPASLRRGVNASEAMTKAVAELYLAGVPINFGDLHRPFERCNVFAPLPGYAFDVKRYWLDYHNNWCLTKGEDAPVPAAVPPPQPVAGAPTTIYSTSCQRVVREQIDPAARVGTVVFESNLAEPNLRKVISGHVINEVALCPSSLNADMAMTAAGYLWRRIGGDAAGPVLTGSEDAAVAGSAGIAAVDIGLNITNVEVHTPLIPDDETLDNGRFLIQIEATADLNAGTASIVFRSYSSPDRTGPLVEKEHGSGEVRFEDRAAWQAEWRRLRHFVKSQISHVHEKGNDGRAHVLQADLVYKLFASLCDYQGAFRGMREVTVEAAKNGRGVAEPEAIAKVSFQDSPAAGTFFCSPYWIDSVCHLSGFVVNSGVASDRTDDNGYISHGWGGLRIATQLRRDRQYTAYVCMQPDGKMMVGDVYFLDGDEIVAVTSGLKFQGIPRRALQVMLPKKKGAMKQPMARSVAQPPAKKAEAAPRKKQAFRAKAGVAQRQPPPPRATTTRPSLVSRAMAIIQAETDVPSAELIDAASFDSLGVDSLMGLTIVAKFREDLDMDVASSVFMDVGTVGEFKEWMAKQFPEPAADRDGESSDPSLSPATGNSTDGYNTDHTGLTTPSPASSVRGKGAAEITSASVSSHLAKGNAALAKKVIATEMGVDEAELAQDLVLADIGMDSLMSLTVLGELRDQLGIDLPSDFLTVNPTMGDIERAIGVSEGPEAPADSAGSARGIEVANSDSGYAATSVLLQGSSKAGTKLFMIPDGSGSATSYAELPPLKGDIAVFGLNCPFLKIPEKWTTGIPGLAALYITEMRRRQPSGPYYLAGWSAGGIIAYEMLVQLARTGERVEKLFLLDSPCPIKLEPLPARLHDFFDQIGFLGSGRGKAPEWLVPHFQASVRALAEYEPERVTDNPRAHIPEIVAIWAEKGVCGKESGRDATAVLTGEDPAPMRWLLNDRTDFGDNGWGVLFGPKKNRMRFETVRSHHFEIFKGESGKKLAALLREGVSGSP